MNTAKGYYTGQSVNTEYLDKFAEYAEKVTNMHRERLMKGRNLDVRWAIEYNKSIDADSKLSTEQKEKRKFNIFMPGMDRFEGTELKTLKLNPFQPAGIPGAPVDMMTRVEQVTALFNASLPNSDVLPVIVDEAIYKYIHDIVGAPLLDGDMKALIDYPKLNSGLRSRDGNCRSDSYAPDSGCD